MFKPRQRPLPQTTEECEMLLEIVLVGANSRLIPEQKNAVMALDRLVEKRCTKALAHIMYTFGDSSDLFKQQLCKKARENL